MVQVKVNGHALNLCRNVREPKSCLGRVFNSKLGCLAILHCSDAWHMYGHL